MRSTIFFLLSTSIALVAAIPTAINERADGGAGYTGAGGSSEGGSTTSVESSQGALKDAQVLDVDTGNGGDGGKAKSGDAFGGHGATSINWVDGHPVYYAGNGGAAYSGVGGNTNGGDVGKYQTGQGYGYYGYGWSDGTLDSLDVGNIGSKNAGDGGDSSSGNSFGGNAA